MFGGRIYQGVILIPYRGQFACGGIFETALPRATPFFQPEEC